MSLIPHHLIAFAIYLRSRCKKLAFKNQINPLAKREIEVLGLNRGGIEIFCQC